jgi:hypothetical protein
VQISPECLHSSAEQSNIVKKYLSILFCLFIVHSGQQLYERMLQDENGCSVSIDVFKIAPAIQEANAVHLGGMSMPILYVYIPFGQRKNRRSDIV